MEKKYEKITISLPSDMLEILDTYAEYEGLTRSGSIAYLLARGLAEESTRSNGFDFISNFEICTKKDGEEIVMKRSDIQNLKVTEWVFALGRNRRRESVIVSNKDFLEDE